MACPSPERLVDFVDGRLADRDQLVLESHLDACEDCRVAAAAIVKRPAPSLTLGRYEIGDVLGAGGMGIVYRAWDPALSREVAVKVVKSDDRDLRTRLTSEARSLARLNHPNVCQVYDVGGVDGSGDVWIAMELVHGPTLRAWVAGKPPRDEVIAMLAQAGRGIAAAHAAGLVHRDIKPENILVHRDGRAVVSDFGLARITEDRATRTSVLAGTPAYMAPEQLDASPADERSDQYAFAVTVHEALVGTRPRPRNTASDTLPPRLRAALDRALADDPAKRYPSITQLLDAIAAANRKRSRAVPLALAAAGVAAFVVAGVAITRHGAAADVGDATTTTANRSPDTATATTPATANRPPDTTTASRPPDTATATTPTTANRSPDTATATTPANRATTDAKAAAANRPAIAAVQAPTGVPGPIGASAPTAPAAAAAPAAPGVVLDPTRVHLDPNRVKLDPSRVRATGGMPSTATALPAPSAPPTAVLGGNHLANVSLRANAGDGAGCLAELAQVDPNDPSYLASAKQLAVTRALCVMLAGRCTEGRRAMREAQQALAGGTLDDKQLDRDVDTWAMTSCRAGEMSDRDRLLRALYIFQDRTHKASVAECRAAYADALRLAPTFANADQHDILFDVIRRVRNSAPACFARAGDCASAWQVAKDVDTKLPLDRPATDETHRALFSWAINQDCADHDQGALSDTEQALRALDELHEVRKRGTPTAAYCTARIDAGVAALAKTTSHDVAAMSHELPKLGAVCLALAGDCPAAWQAFSRLVGETDPQRARSEFRSEVRECRFAAPGKLSPAEQVAWAAGVLEDGSRTKASASTCKAAYDALVANADVTPRGDVARHVAGCYAEVDDCQAAWSAYQDATQRFSHHVPPLDVQQREFAQATKCAVP